MGDLAMMRESHRQHPCIQQRTNARYLCFFARVPECVLDILSLLLHHVCSSCVYDVELRSKDILAATDKETSRRLRLF